MRKSFNPALRIQSRERLRQSPRALWRNSTVICRHAKITRQILQNQQRICGNRLPLMVQISGSETVRRLIAHFYEMSLSFSFTRCP